MVSDHCPVCPVCLSATLVYCGQTVGCNKIKLGTEVGLDPSHIVLGGDSASLEKGHSLQFWPMSVVAKRSPILATAEHLFSC